MVNDYKDNDIACQFVCGYVLVVVAWWWWLRPKMKESHVECE